MDYLKYRTKQALDAFLRKQVKMPQRYAVRVKMERRDPHVQWPEVRLTPSGVPYAELQLLNKGEVKDFRPITPEEYHGIVGDPLNWEGACSLDGTCATYHPSTLPPPTP